MPVIRSRPHATDGLASAKSRQRRRAVLLPAAPVQDAPRHETKASRSMNRSKTLPLLVLLIVAACDGPAEEAGERIDEARGEAEGIADGPQEGIGEQIDAAAANARQAREAAADAVEDRADVIREQAEVEADRLEDEADRLRKNAEKQAKAIEQSVER